MARVAPAKINVFGTQFEGRLDEDQWRLGVWASADSDG
jgi:hypothetical protein